MKIRHFLSLPLFGFLALAPFAPATAQNITNGLELYLQFNGNAGDSSHNANHGIVEGATLTTDRFGNANGAYAFDNGNNIRVKNFSSSGFDGITMSAWVQTDKTSPQQQVVQGNFGVLYINWIKSGYFMGAFDGTGNNNSSTDISTSLVADGKWHHITATNDGTKTRVYVDGTLEATYNETLNTGTSDVQIGGGGWYFTGKMDEIRIYNRALSSTEVQSVYAFVTGIDDVDNTSAKSALQIKVFPNPVQGNRQFNIALPAGLQNAVLSITTLSGQEIHTQALGNNKEAVNIPLSLTGYSSGVYLINVASDKGVTRTKLILQ